MRFVGKAVREHAFELRFYGLGLTGQVSALIQSSHRALAYALTLLFR